MWIAADIKADGLPVGLREIPDPTPPAVVPGSSRNLAFLFLQGLADALGILLVQARLLCLGKGLNHDVYLGWFQIQEAATHLPAVARVPKLGSASVPPNREDFLHRLRFLEALATRDLGVQIPRTYGALQTRRGWATVQSGLEGIQPDLLRDRLPIEPLAQAAAICHRLNPQGLSKYLPPCENRRSFALQELEIIRDTQIPGGSKALRWAQQKLPPEEPCRIVHGDLLPQNILLGFDLKLGGILDWDCASLGDPAYDLAVITGGVARPFKLNDGLLQLVQAYNLQADHPISCQDVQLYELCVRAHEYADAIRHSGRKSGHASTVAQGFQGLLRRIGAD